MSNNVPATLEARLGHNWIWTSRFQKPSRNPLKFILISVRFLELLNYNLNPSFFKNAFFGLCMNMERHI